MAVACIPGHETSSVLARRRFQWISRPRCSWHVAHGFPSAASLADALQIFIVAGMLVVAVPSIDLAPASNRGRRGSSEARGNGTYVCFSLTGRR